MRRLWISFFLFLTILLLANNAPQVEDITFSQREDGSHIVDIYFNLIDQDGDSLSVNIFASNDGGQTWDYPMIIYTGDFGENISSGSGKHIVWDFAVDHPDVWEPEMQFKINVNDGYEVANTAPDMAVNPLPENGMIDVPVNIVLSWECSDPEGDELSFDVYFGEIIELDYSHLIAENITDASWVLENMNNNTTFYWKIISSDGEFETEGEVWNFTTIEEELSCDWCFVHAGPYTWGEYDEIQTIDYYYEIMKYEITNTQYVAYLEEAFAVGDVWIEDDEVYGHYEGDENNDEGDYAFYSLGTPYNYNYARISYDGSSFIMNIPSGYNAGDFNDHPVAHVNWFGATAFAEYYGWRLPTEQEWEKAARGLTGYDYIWGNNLSGDRANYKNSGDPWERGSTPVGYYNGENGTIDSPSPYGCYDMCGNVWDWTANWDSGISPMYRVMRGGSWYSNCLHSWFRSGSYPNYTMCYNGFRCARTVEVENTVPDMPVNPSPENGMIDVPVHIALSWECVDPDGDELSYDVYFSENIELDDRYLVAEYITDASWVLENLNINTTYYWKITASDGEFETEGEVWDFTTIEEENNEDWAYVAAGTYTWGSYNEIQTIDYDYEIMKYKITNAQYLAYLEEAYAAGDVWIESGDVYGYYEGDERYDEGDYLYYDLGSPSEYNYAQISYDGSSFVINMPSGYNAGDFNDHPVVKVNWIGANVFAERYGWRLPTEQEWEKAARGMTGYDYPWGDNLSGERANYSDSGDPWDNGTTPIGYYNGENGTIDSPSPYGCYDMCGNVFDWTDSWDGDNFIRRVLRGGSWSPSSSSSYLFSKYGYSSVAILETNYWGFRCARVNTAPDMPVNPLPENGMIDVPVNIILSWECSDPEWDELSFDVYFGEIPELDGSHLIAEDITEAFWVLENLNIVQTYYWKITASDGEFETEGDVWSFTTLYDEYWAYVAAGTYNCGQNDEIQTIGYDYEIMKYEINNAQYLAYLEEAYAAGDIWIEDDDVYGYYEGDENYGEGDYIYYDLGSPSEYNYAQISYDGNSFIINVPAGYNAGDFDDHSVVYVSWFGSNAYSEHYGWRLPTEQEWEKAARGMTGYDYSWGDNLSGDRANYSGSGDPWDNGTTPVGYYNGENGTIDSPSAYGCYDMCGNVFDWTDSWYGSYANRVLRGGSWFYDSYYYYFRSWFWIHHIPSNTDNHVGFRCASTIDVENTAPDMPENPSPENGAIDVSVYTSLSWECTDLTSYELSYDVYFGEIIELDGSHLIAEDITEAGWVLENLNRDTTYYWKITASDGEFQTEGEVWSFTTLEEENNEYWAYVAAGTYTWGSDNEIQTIYYDYEIMKYEVTNAQYVAYLEEAYAAGDVWIEENNTYGTRVCGYFGGDEYWGAGNYDFYHLGTPSIYNYGRISYDGSSFIINVPSGYSAGEFDDHSVVFVSCFGAKAYAEHYGWRLPIEEEWEKAARGMTGYRYPWGDDLSADRANFRDNGDPWDNGITPVGFYNGQNFNGFQTTDSPSPYGCYDMCGNVYDWTDSVYDYYNALRGGAWSCSESASALVSWSGWMVFYPSCMINDISFRCARTVDVENTAPELPENPSPENGAIDVPVYTSLSWECTDLTSYVLSYDVYFGEIPELDVSHLIAEDIAEVFWVLANLNIDQTYYWKITASDGELETESEVWNFTTFEEEHSDGIVFVEGGTFEMGDHFNEGHDYELPVHDVTLNSFFIGQYEVTQGEYESLMGNNPSNFTNVGVNAPVEQITWYNAVEYCNALSLQEGLTPCYDLSSWSCDFSAAGYRLPTEAEWEYASRGGVNWTDNYRYSGCHEESDLGDYAWFGDYYDSSHEVGTKEPNQLDIYDMTGNVAEWCNDWYSSSYYGSSPASNPTGADSGPFRVIRGGHWSSNAQDCRVAYRNRYGPDFSYNILGFRILRAYPY